MRCVLAKHGYGSLTELTEVPGTTDIYVNDVPVPVPAPSNFFKCKPGAQIHNTGKENSRGFLVRV